MSEVKPKRKKTRKVKEPVIDPMAQVKAEVELLANSREGQMEHIVLHETGTSIQICCVDKTIILGEVLFPSPTRDLAIRIEDGTLAHLISWNDDLPILQSLLGR